MLTGSLRATLVAAVLAAACAFAAPAALADGDPASDVLLYQQVFLPFNVKLPPASVTELKRIVGAANKRGYTVKVALIGDQTDLGSVTPLWRKPQRYAAFLSQELLGPSPYTNRVLTVMPNGYGLSKNGRNVPQETNALPGIESPAASDRDLATAAIGVVQRLAALKGVKLQATLPDTKEEDGDGGFAWPLLLGGIVTLLVVLTGLETWRRLRRR